MDLTGYMSIITHKSQHMSPLQSMFWNIFCLEEIRLNLQNNRNNTFKSNYLVVRRERRAAMGIHILYEQ